MIIHLSWRKAADLRGGVPGSWVRRREWRNSRLDPGSLYVQHGVWERPQVNRSIGAQKLVLKIDDGLKAPVRAVKLCTKFCAWVASSPSCEKASSLSCEKASILSREFPNRIKTNTGFTFSFRVCMVLGRDIAIPLSRFVGGGGSGERLETTWYNSFILFRRFVNDFPQIFREKRRKAKKRVW